MIRADDSAGIKSKRPTSLTLAGRAYEVTYTLQPVPKSQGIPWSVLSCEQKLALITTETLFSFVVQVQPLKEDREVVINVIVNACVNLPKLFGKLRGVSDDP